MKRSHKSYLNTSSPSSMELSPYRDEEINQVTQHIRKLIYEEQNYMLLKEIILLYVEEVFMNMPKSKAPSPYGFTVKFYQ